jgi:two-component system, NtrC family, sensor kinase
MEEECCALPKNGRRDLPSPNGRLRILILGNPECLADSTELLKSLTLIGYSIAVMGAVADPPIEGDEREARGLRKIWLDEIRGRVQDSPPDLVIQTTDSPELLKRITHLMPPHTRILDSFVLRIVKGLKEMSGQLAVARSRLQLIKEVLMSGPGISLMVVDEDLEILEINNAILERARMSAKDCIGKPCHWVLSKGMKPCHCRGDYCVAQEALRTGRSVHTMREGSRASDSEDYFTVSAYPLGTDDRGKDNVLVIWKDITRSMTQVLNEQARDMQETFFETLRKDKMAALGQLAAAAVHEINNPIQGILTFAKLMRQSFDKESLDPEEMEKFRSYLDLIGSESARCGQILRNLLSFARLGNLEKTAFDLALVVDEVLMLVRHRMSLHGIEIKAKIGENLLPLWGDRSQVKQALLNLVMNSMDAMPTGGCVRVTADMDQERDHIKIRVIDTGTGIPRALQSNVWEPFVTTKEMGRGVGLGLSVVYGIVTQHGGSVDMHSEENLGTVFTLSLPVYVHEQRREGP